MAQVVGIGGSFVAGDLAEGLAPSEGLLGGAGAALNAGFAFSEGDTLGGVQGTVAAITALAGAAAGGPGFALLPAFAAGVFAIHLVEDPGSPGFKIRSRVGPPGTQADPATQRIELLPAPFPFFAPGAVDEILGEQRIVRAGNPRGAAPAGATQLFIVQKRGGSLLPGSPLTFEGEGAFGVDRTIAEGSIAFGIPERELALAIAAIDAGILPPSFRFGGGDPLETNVERRIVRAFSGRTDVVQEPGRLVPLPLILPDDPGVSAEILRRQGLPEDDKAGFPEFDVRQVGAELDPIVIELTRERSFETDLVAEVFRQAGVQPLPAAPFRAGRGTSGRIRAAAAAAAAAGSLALAGCAGVAERACGAAHSLCPCDATVGNAGNAPCRGG